MSEDLIRKSTTAKAFNPSIRRLRTDNKGSHPRPSVINFRWDIRCDLEGPAGPPPQPPKCKK